MENNKLELLALSLIPGLGDQNIKHLISYCGSPSEVFKVSKSKLEKIPGLGPKTASSILGNKSLDEAERILKEAESKGMEVMTFLDKSYPARLKGLMDAPPVLFKKGQGELNVGRSVAIVGTRMATPYGKNVTATIVEELAGLNVQVISGLAYGIDVEAHKAALQQGASTVGVLAGGLDWIYPAAHKKYAVQMEANGAIVSESLPGTKPDPHLFPARNRIIAGMADAVIVVEAAEKGGALITAKIADSYNRALFAVPGNLDNTYSAGTNHLISTQTALIYTGVKDLADQLGWDLAKKEKQPFVLPEMNEQEKLIFEFLSTSGSPREIDHISIQTQIPINQVASVLLGLEFKNLVKCLPGKKYGLK